MSDLIEGRADFAFFTFAFAIFLWVAISPRRALQVLLLRREPPTIGEAYLPRLIAILNSPALAGVLIWHVWRLIRAYFGPPE